jgi:prophage antirepressor-like protein
MTVATTQVVLFSYKDSQVRTVHVDGEPFFVASDICSALNLKDTSSAVRDLDDDEYLLRVVSGAGQDRSVLVINESGLYHLIFKSRKDEAKAFRKWVTSEVIPALRRTGRYEMGQGTGISAGGRQLSLFPEMESMEQIRIRDLIVDLALQAKSGSKLAQFIRLVKPLVMRGKGGTAL